MFQVVLPTALPSQHRHLLRPGPPGTKVGARTCGERVSPAPFPPPGCLEQGLCLLCPPLTPEESSKGGSWWIPWANASISGDFLVSPNTFVHQVAVGPCLRGVQEAPSLTPPLLLAGGLKLTAVAQPSKCLLCSVPPGRFWGGSHCCVSITPRRTVPGGPMVTRGVGSPPCCRNTSPKHGSTAPGAVPSSRG